jgi:hypothetical protein
MVLSSIILFSFNKVSSISNAEIEEKARAIGMKYPEEFKVINKKDEVK